MQPCTPKPQQIFSGARILLQLMRIITNNQTAQNFWNLSKKTEDVEEFRKLHNLILVESTPQDPAFMPSWPQALVQYILINSPINCFSTSSHEINGQVVSSFTITPFNILQLLLSPFLFVAWVVAFGMTQASFKTGGWMSVLGWAMWFDLSQFYNVFAAIPLIFQYPASLALVIQRWHSDLGRVAYEVTNLYGCTPYQGLDYLQQGAQFSQFRILQTVTFSISTLFGLMSLGNKGLLDSPINTRWKAFASFMGF